MLFFILPFIWQPFPLFTVVNLVVFIVNYKAQENKASKKNLWSAKKLKLFEHKKWSNATTLHLILKKKELVRGVQAQRMELWDLVKGKKKCGEYEKKLKPPDFIQLV